MIFSHFIASRIHKPLKGSFSSVIGRIAIGSIALGTFVIMISCAILLGFQKNIQQKIFSFGGHIQVKKYDLNPSFEESPILLNETFMANALANPDVKSISAFSHKAGLIKSGNEVLGILVKGIGPGYNDEFFKQNITKGRLIAFKDSTGQKEVNISQKIADKMNIEVGDFLVVYFVQNPPRMRKLNIVGIFESGMEEFDESFVISDINLIRKINKWEKNEAGGYEITVKDFDKLEEVASFVFETMDYNLGLEKIRDQYLAVFDWLDLLDQNVKIFLSLITFVACFNMMSSLFIMVLERTNMIGTLKGLGASNRLVGSIFFLNNLGLVWKGLLTGNVLAGVFCLLQYNFKIIPLDKENYYMDAVPIFWDWQVFLFVNIILALVLCLVLWFPSIVINKVQPIKSIKFD